MSTIFLLKDSLDTSDEKTTTLLRVICLFERFISERKFLLYCETILFIQIELDFGEFPWVFKRIELFLTSFYLFRWIVRKTSSAGNPGKTIICTWWTATIKVILSITSIKSKTKKNIPKTFLITEILIRVIILDDSYCFLKHKLGFFK